MITVNASLNIRDLTITFSRWGQTVKALNGINLNVSDGQWVMLVGHNGSGKSTLLNAISGRFNNNGTSGKIHINGNDLSKMTSSEISQSVFHVHQDPLMGTAPTLTIFENLMVADQHNNGKKVSRKELSKKYQELLRTIDLSERMKQLVKYLSGGERQLLALLVAELRPSTILLLDEPLAALDPSKAEMCLDLIRNLHESGKTIVQVTHDISLAAECGDRTVLLSQGQVVYDQMGKERDRNTLKKLWVQ